MTLRDFFFQNPRAAVAFSGGVDSAVLLWAAKTYGQQVRAYCVRSPFQPVFELEDAKRLANSLNVTLTVLEADPLSAPEVAANGPDRCYLCKHLILSTILRAARRDGLPLVVDGSNASDDPTQRPGMRAVSELGVRSPLRECGLDKQAVRQLAQKAGLSVWNKPAYACLATRVPTGTPITREDLARVERAEATLAGLGFSDFRVRLFHGGARIQLPPEQLARAVTLRDTITAALSADFPAILLDLIPRS